ncbi:hypothetical protein [Sphaerimonospora thailandensis]|uniref:Uncharacterized protein n=1 Tax=Sphaerimonospora thailandensis TaxID=795644 RepID=A0A8J3R480_9ACTN|nr:hypothetical protein [Sphaerimonospora thailandensis]GIH68153.1 hypothetical protein Mth01_04060 [Sphaerimonospora thailandensis]
MTMESGVAASRFTVAGFLAVVRTLSCAALAYAALFLTHLAYLFDVYKYDWEPELAHIIDPDAVAAIFFLLLLAFILATGSALLVRRYLTTWIVYGLFVIPVAIRFSQILPLM